MKRHRIQILTYTQHAWSDQLGFFSVPNLLLHGASVFNCGHLQGPVTLSTVAERLAVELSLPIFTISVYNGCDSNFQPSACEANAITDYGTAAAKWLGIRFLHLNNLL